MKIMWLLFYLLFILDFLLLMVTMVAEESDKIVDKLAMADTEKDWFER